MTLLARIRQLDAQRIEAATQMAAMAARLDALEAAVNAIAEALCPGGDLLWACPQCGFLATKPGPCAACAKEEEDGGPIGTATETP